VETSPRTAEPDRLRVLKERGVRRISMGVQSFVPEDLISLKRPQPAGQLEVACQMIKASGFPVFNIDLIYGIEGQTQPSWRRSLDEALEFTPQEVYLYPLYVRPLTHLDQIGSHSTDMRREFYRAGREHLLNQGYRQISMRLFRHESYAPPEGPVYCCQEDGMVGLGPGARSYTKALHYSTEYAVGRTGVLEIIQDFVGRTREQFSFANYGCELDLEEQKRRYVLKSLLRSDGLELADYTAFFHSNVCSDLPQLAELAEEELAVEAQGYLKLTPEGLELSDVIGPWLWSPAMRERMNEFALR